MLERIRLERIHVEGVDVFVIVEIVISNVEACKCIHISLFHNKDKDPFRNMCTPASVMSRMPCMIS